mgnify:CR=1 FL=1
MKLFYALLILFFFQNCSFDNKTGIWKNEKSISKIEKNVFDEFETLYSANNSFQKTVNIKENFKFNLPNKVINYNWRDIFYNKNNNYNNFSYNNLAQLTFKSKKITNNKINKNILFEDNNIIASDQRGNILIFSLDENRITEKFNFYKKKYKKVKKNLNLMVENNTIYVSDNIGFIYAYNYKIRKIIWAKNYKIPFRSNLKILDNKLIASNQNNNLYFFDKTNGDNLRLIPTEETKVNNLFTNNLALNNDFLFYLNTYGSLYAIDGKNMKMRWFLNLNQSSNLNPTNLFLGNIITIYQNKLVIFTNKFLYILDTENGSTIFKKEFTSYVKPIIINNYLFLISSNNFLISVDLTNGKIIYSYDLNEKIAEFLGSKKKNAEFNSFAILENKIFIFLKNSFYLQLDIDGSIEKINRLPSKLNSEPIFIDSSILFLNNKNKLVIVD